MPMSRDFLNRFAMASVALTLLASAPRACEADLIALYQFNDPANLGRDTSGGGHTATVFGATYAASGYQDGAASLNGSAFLRVALDVSPTALPRMTWGAWVKPTATDPIRAVLSTDNAGFDRDIDIDSRGGSTAWSAFTGNGVLSSGVSPSTSQWTFLAVAYNQPANTLSFYVDGIGFGVATNFGGSQGFFDIGHNPSFGEFFGGSIDNVFVYDRVLSVSEIQALRNNGFPASLVPEPSSLLLTLAGLVPLAFLRRRRGMSHSPTA